MVGASLKLGTARETIIRIVQPIFAAEANGKLVLLMPDILQRLHAAYMENPASALDVLPEFFQAMEDGKVIWLPCKVGDAAYLLLPKQIGNLCIDPLHKEIAKMEIWGVEIRNGSIWITDGDRYSGEFGKTVFLTHESAEAALTALKGESHENS